REKSGCTPDAAIVDIPFRPGDLAMRPVHAWWLTLISAGVLVGSYSIGRAQEAPKSPAKITYSKDVAPILDKYCISCHGGRKPKADMALDIYKDDSAFLEHRKVWEGVVRNLRSRRMPPDRRPKPSQAEVDVVANWLESELAKIDCKGIIDPGRVTIRRL